jgi:hypothetical protein
MNLTTINPKLAVVLFVLATSLGVGTGYGLQQLYAQNAPDQTGTRQLKQVPTEEAIAKGDIFGSPDESTFKDTAQGYLAAGGLDGEGSHRLLRPGGETQTVYLTSSITDLDKFVGMEVKIWGETFKGQKAGWLMDVGRIEVLRVEGEEPQE